MRILSLILSLKLQLSNKIQIRLVQSIWEQNTDRLTRPEARDSTPPVPHIKPVNWHCRQKGLRILLSQQRYVR